MAMKSLEDLFLDKLKDIHDAERRITRALPRMIRAATSPELSEAFEEHLQVTEQQIERLDQIFERLGKSPGRKPCHGMMGILEEGSETLEEKDAPESVMDAALIAGAQEVEHYEIAAYGCLETWAKVLGRNEEARLLKESLKEEEETDQKLTRLASTINSQAMSEGDESEEEQEMASVGRRGGNGSTSSSGGRKSRRR
jgi:ferritin-like metal-binding protein YciE